MLRAHRQNLTHVHLAVRGWIFLLVGFGLGGCQMGMLSSTPLTTTKFTLEQTEKLVLQDPWCNEPLAARASNTPSFRMVKCKSLLILKTARAGSIESS